VATGNTPRPGRALAVVAVILAALFGGMFLSGQHSPKLGLDLRGGTSVTLTPVQTEGGKVPASALNQSVNIMRQRVNGLGVSESEVTTEGNNIIISVPGKHRDEVLKLVGTTAQLRFRQVLEQGPPTPSKEPSTTTPPTGVTPELQKEFDAFDCTNPESPQRTGLGLSDDANKPVVACSEDGGAKLLLDKAALVGTDVKSAEAAIPQGQLSWIIQLTFTNSGTTKFADFTKNHVGQNFAIVLDGVVQSAPVIQNAIPNGQAEISGSFTAKTAKDLAQVLKYGALPITFKQQQVNSISPTLGNDQLKAGLLAGAIGLGLIILYLLMYYRGLGIIAILSLGLSAAILWPLIVILGEAMGFTLTLAGIAGLIVAIGITADSFIVYFERVRDEVREGRSLRAAAERGWVRARKTVVAADAVSLIAAGVLWFVSVGSVRGFAFTLGLSNAVDLIIVFLFTKPLMTLFVRTRYFGQGRRFSGLDPSRLGVKRPVEGVAATAGASKEA
jgi:preprotein translocase subunit SecD